MLIVYVVHKNYCKTKRNNLTHGADTYERSTNNLSEVRSHGIIPSLSLVAPSIQNSKAASNDSTWFGTPIQSGFKKDAVIVLPHYVWTSTPVKNVKK